MAAPTPARTPAVPLAPLRRLPRTTEDTLVRTFFASLTRPYWDQVLGMHAVDSPAGRLLSLLYDPSYESAGIERICRDARIDFKELVRVVSDHELGNAIAASAQRAAEVMSSITDDAINRDVLCDLCLGWRDDEDDITSILVDHPRLPGEKLKIECPKCGGTGSRKQSGDARAREVYLKLHGHLQEGPQVVVDNRSQTNIINGQSGSVQRGQQLLAMGRKLGSGRSQHALNAPGSVLDVVLVEQNGQKQAENTPKQPEMTDFGPKIAKNSENTLNQAENREFLAFDEQGE